MIGTACDNGFSIGREPRMARRRWRRRIMAAKRVQAKERSASADAPAVTDWLPPTLLAWLVPGAGHFYLKRYWHGVILLAAVAAMFVCGLLMQGRMYVPMGGNLFTTVMTYGGYLGDLCNGSLYLLAVGLGYEQEMLPGAIHDYGTKFLVCSGLLNLLAVVDTYEIASGKKQEALLPQAPA